ncbi:hypothetical protein BDC45DRAFT_564409 [Circinella umbellata]|nr:hypothetical protein BDC45DRAFT_564409 [Circinella umbellata]
MRSLLNRFRTRKLSPGNMNGNGVRKLDVKEGPPKNADESAAIIEELNQTFDVSLAQMKNISEQLKKEMQKGLNQEGATVAMLPTFVSGRPTGEEKGRYLALDLGGTFLRVCEVDLCGNKEFKIQQKKYKVPLTLKEGDFRDLCDFIAECLDNFIAELNATGSILSSSLSSSANVTTAAGSSSNNSTHDTSSGSSNNGIEPSPVEKYQLGFTFSFPLFQTDINRGVLKQWTKGYSCTNSVHEDVVEMLQDAFLRKQVPVNIAAIVNDAVGTLMALAYSVPETAIGVILGTGTNACYYEKIKDIKKWDGGETLNDEMVVNTEWGAFDCERLVLPLTVHDRKVDRESLRPRQQMFEKMISGMYLGEISRNVILHLIDRQIIFDGYSSNDFNKQHSFDTAYMSSIELDNSPDLQETRHILEDVLSIPSTSLMDRQLVKGVCEIVGRRAARLSACGIAAVLKQSNLVTSGCTIGIDGSLFEHYPCFEANMMQALKDMFGPYISYKVKFSLARDGSGLGAAIVAMLAHKNSQKATSSGAPTATSSSVSPSVAEEKEQTQPITDDEEKKTPKEENIIEATESNGKQQDIKITNGNGKTPNQEDDEEQPDHKDKKQDIQKE